MDDILYGKADIPRIINIEDCGNQVEIFQLDEEFNRISTKIDRTLWVLSNKQLKEAVTLDGNQHFKYALPCKDTGEINKWSNILRSCKADTYTVYNPVENFMIKYGYTYYHDLLPTDLPILSFDIETTGLDNRAPDAKVLLITNTFRKNGVITSKTFKFDDYPSDKDMIGHWCEWVREMDPVIMCGHNIFGYDLPYLNRFNRLPLGVDGSNAKFSTRESKFRVDGSRDLHYNNVNVYGREIIDTMFLAYRYDIASKKYDSYGLKPIIKVEGLEKKDRQFYDASKIRTNYKIKEEWEKIVAYAEEDSDDALKLFDLMAPSQFFFTRNIPRSFQSAHQSASGSQINSMLVRAYLQQKRSIPKATEVEHFQGGISFGNSGIYRNCLKLDIKSAYPSAILIEKLYDKEKDPEAYLYKLCHTFTHKRFEYKKLYKETKKDYYLAMDASSKIFINSIFGATGAPGLNFNSPKIAGKITELVRGYLNHCSIWGTSKELNEWISDNE